MRFKIPKNTEKYEWTQHAIGKMRHYGLTAQRVLRLVNNPQRVEEGGAENTIAVMQPASTHTKNGKRVWSSEIWAMYQIKGKSKNVMPEAPARIALQIKAGGNQSLAEKRKTFTQQKIRLISTWRYSGISPKRDPIPDDILRELKSML